MIRYKELMAERGWKDFTEQSRSLMLDHIRVVEQLDYERSDV